MYLLLSTNGPQTSTNWPARKSIIPQFLVMHCLKSIRFPLKVYFHNTKLFYKEQFCIIWALKLYCIHSLFAGKLKNSVSNSGNNVANRNHYLLVDTFTHVRHIICNTRLKILNPRGSSTPITIKCNDLALIKDLSFEWK